MKITKRFLIVVSFLLVFLSAVAFAQLPVPRAALEHAIAIQERYTDDLMADPEVVGTGVGVGANGEAVIKVFVISPSSAGFRGTLDGVPIITQLMGEVRALKGPPPGKGGGGEEEDPPAADSNPCDDDSTARCYHPVPIGVSTGHPAITAGTIGARVTDDTDVWALSNNHVYAATNSATIGEAVIQPGTFDGGSSPTDDIGTLADFEPIDFNGGDNVIDAAIALSSTEWLRNYTPPNGYGTPKSQTIAATPGMRVMKFGRTTGQTKGRVDAINATIDVNYGASHGVARFIEQIVVTPGNFSAGGDSGSLIVVQRGSDSRKPVGLLFAGSFIATIANPIDVVLTRFGVTVDGE